MAPNDQQRDWSSGFAASKKHGTPKLTTPQNDPGFTLPKAIGPFEASAQQRHCSTSMPNGYTCPELQPMPGITPDRFDAFALPSRMGNRLHYPCGRVEVLA